MFHPCQDHRQFDLINDTSVCKRSAYSSLLKDLDGVDAASIRRTRHERSQLWPNLSLELSAQSLEAANLNS